MTATTPQVKYLHGIKAGDGDDAQLVARVLAAKYPSMIDGNLDSAMAALGASLHVSAWAVYRWLLGNRKPPALHRSLLLSMLD